MPYDYSKLNGKIAEKFGTHGNFAIAIGLSERSLSLKLKNTRGFKQREITIACDLLGIGIADIHEYFFTPEVQFF